MEFPFEKAAMRGEPMPEDLKFPEKYVFIALSHLYKQYRSGLLTRMEASGRKTALITDYAAIREKEDALDAHLSKSAAMWQRIEFATSEIQRDLMLMENTKVRALLTAIYGVEPGMLKKGV